MPERHLSADVIIIGAGLAGLTAAISLQQQGKRVLVLECRESAGGLCGTTRIGKYEFTLACNDFGSGIERVMAQLGVSVTFRRRATRFHCGRESYTLPPTGTTLINMLRHSPDAGRLLRALRRPSTDDRYEYLGPLLEASVRSQPFADYLSIAAYAFGSAPDRYPLQQFRQTFSKELDYGYDRTTIPLGGPQALINAMTKRLAELGGELVLGTRVHSRATSDGLKIAHTDRDTYRARHLITSEGRLKDYPPETSPSLAAGMLRLATHSDVVFPEHIHTLGHFPDGAAHWLYQLETGKMPKAFGFHVVPCTSPGVRDHRTFNVYFLCPRGMSEPSADIIHGIQDYIFERLSSMLPSLTDKVLLQHFVSPGQFAEAHGLSTELVAAVAPPTFSKPEIYDEESDLYHVGNTVGPPGQHAGAAVRCGLQAAEAVIMAASRKTGDPA